MLGNQIVTGLLIDLSLKNLVHDSVCMSKLDFVNKLTKQLGLLEQNCFVFYLLNGRNYTSL